jgi:hypothetical protein
LPVEWRQYRAAIFKGSQAVEANGVEPLEDVAVFPMHWGIAMGIDEALNFLEARDDALFAWRATALLFRLRELSQLVGQFVEGGVTHSAPLS